MKTKNLERPRDVVWGQNPGRRQGCMAQEDMIWKLVQEHVIGQPAESTSADYELMWRVKKDKMEVATGVTWTESEWGPRALQLRGYLLRDFWAIFVDDRPFHSDSLYRHVNVQSKGVFFHAMTVMDKVRGWTDEENGWDQNLRHACGFTPRWCLLQKCRST